MSAGQISDDSCPRLAAHRRLRFDTARKSWTIQAPERVFLLDDIAHAVVSRCNGENSLARIVDDLCASFQAPRDVVACDVQTLIQDLVHKRVMEL